MYYTCFNVNVKSLGYKHCNYDTIMIITIGRILCRLGGVSVFCFQEVLGSLIIKSSLFLLLIIVSTNINNMPKKASCRSGEGSVLRISLINCTIYRNTLYYCIKTYIECIYCVGRASPHIRPTTKFLQVPLINTFTYDEPF